MFLKIVSVIVMSALLTGAGRMGPESDEIEQYSPSVDEEYKMQINWIYNLQEGLDAAAEKEKPLMVYFGADWCVWCRRMENETYADPKVIELSEYFVSVKIDTDDNPEVAREYGVRGLPIVIFMDSDGEIIERVSGYRDGAAFASVMMSFVDR